MMFRCSGSRSLLVVTSLGVLALAAGPLAAHSTFLRAYDYHLSDPGPLRLIVFNGTFEESVDSIPEDRLEALKVSGPGGLRELPHYLWKRGEVGSAFWRLKEALAGRFGGIDERRTSVLPVNFPEPGSYVVAVTQRPARLALTPGTYAEFMAEVGLTDEPVADHGFSDPHHIMRQWYVKSAKAIFQVGDPVTPQPLEPLGLRVEIVPLAHPATLREGDVLELQILLQGAPLPDQIVLAGQGDRRQSLRSDAEGRLALELKDDGVWWIDFAHVVEAPPESEVDHRVHWATLTFCIADD